MLNHPVSRLNQVSPGCQKPAINPHIQQGHCTIQPRPRTANLISCMGGQTHPSHNNTHSTSSPPSSQPCCQQFRTAVVCLINWQWHCLTFDLLPRPRKHVGGIKAHTPWGLLHRLARHLPTMPRPTRSNITGFNANRHANEQEKDDT